MNRSIICKAFPCRHCAACFSDGQRPGGSAPGDGKALLRLKPFELSRLNQPQQRRSDPCTGRGCTVCPLFIPPSHSKRPRIFIFCFLRGNPHGLCPGDRRYPHFPPRETPAAESDCPSFTTARQWHVFQEDGRIPVPRHHPRAFSLYPAHRHPSALLAAGTVPPSGCRRLPHDRQRAPYGTAKNCLIKRK